MTLPISIIIPTFNEEKYLPKLLKSIENQTQLPAEVIVADAFSLDRTRQIARNWGCKIVNGGIPPKARNNGAVIASQSLLLFLDADVVLPRRFLEDTFAEMTQRKLDIASCYVKPISSLKIDAILHNMVNYYFKITHKFMPHVPGFCIFARKSIHQKIKGFDENLVLAEDHDYVQRAKKVGKFAYLNSYKIPVSVRRLNHDGRLNIALKYIAVELHLIFIGKVRKDIFNYKLGDHTHV